MCLFWFISQKSFVTWIFVFRNGLTDFSNSGVRVRNRRYWLKLFSHLLIVVISLSFLSIMHTFKQKNPWQLYASRSTDMANENCWGFTSPVPGRMFVVRRMCGERVQDWRYVSRGISVPVLHVLITSSSQTSTSVPSWSARRHVSTDRTVMIRSAPHRLQQFLY